MLGKFKTDEAFAALKGVYATTGPDLGDSAATPEAADSAANGVRHFAASAIASCGHPDALPFLLKTVVNDSYSAVRMTVLHKAFEVKSPEARAVIAKLTDDLDERVRKEAQRYAKELESKKE
jgi:HEAT repeat protein